MTIIEVRVDLLPDRYSRDLKDHINGKPAEELRHYKRVKEYRAAGYDYWKDLSDAQILKLWTDYFKLYQKIKKEGYKDKPYLKGTIDKMGRHRITAGYHRLSILRVLGIETVIVDWTIAPEFQKFYDHVKSLYPGDRMYQKLDHVVFSNWSVVRGNERPNLILKNLRRGRKYRVLDIGSYMGNISIALGKKGHTVTGLEINQALVDSSNYLAKIEKLGNVSFVCGDAIGHFKGSPIQNYDVIIMFAVDRWITKSHGENALVNLLKDIHDHCNRYFFFESRGAHEKLGLKLIQEHTGFKNKKLIGYDAGDSGRKVWMLRKERRRRR